MDYFDPAFGIMPIIGTIMFVLIFGLIFFVIVSGIIGWHQNNKAPILSVRAKVVAKRTNVSESSNMGVDGASMSSSTSTSYYVTFEVESGNRMEFWVQGKVYGLIAEGDRGKLTFQGTRFLGFDRD